MRIGDLIERVAQDRVDELIDEQWRRFADATSDQINVASFQRFMIQQTVAEADQYLPVFARIRIRNSRDLGGADLPARI